MNRKPYYIPQNFAEFDRFFCRIVEVVLAKVLVPNPEWTHIPPAAAEGLAADYTAWHAAYLAAEGPHTQTETHERQRAYKVAKKRLADFVNQYLRHPPVTNAQRDDMGVPNPDPVKTPVNPPERYPAGDLKFPGIHMIGINNIHPVGNPDADARSEYGTRICYGLSGKPTETHPFRLDAPPESAVELPYSVFIRKKHHTLVLERESGNTIWISLRYENAKSAEKGIGPNGPIVRGIVP
jgi:hypothetical protein